MLCAGTRRSLRHGKPCGQERSQLVNFSLLNYKRHPQEPGPDSQTWQLIVHAQLTTIGMADSQCVVCL